jgi:HAD superfamily hydrolase (TIGR01490 family)
LLWGASLKASFFDLDGTLTNSQWWRGYMAYFQRVSQKRLTHLTFLAVHYPQYMLSKAGLISATQFRRPWASHLAWYLRGFSESDAEPIWQSVIQDFLSKHWREDSLHLLQQKQEQGDLVLLVSACMSPLLQRIGEHLKVKHVVGTELQLRNGVYTGRIAGQVCIANQKAAMSQQYLLDQALSVDLALSETYADSTSDLSLLEMVGNPVAVHPDRKLREIATERGWRIHSA